MTMTLTKARPATGHRGRPRSREAAVCAVLGVLIVATGVLVLATGDYPIPVTDVVATVLGGGTSTQHFIIETLRLPRVLTAVLVGAALATSGALFQSMSRNPLGSPDVIGFDAGSATGALLAILVFHGGALLVAAGAVLGGLATAAVVYLLSLRDGLNGYRLILIGIGVSSMLVSVNSYLLTRADLTDVQAAFVWLTGSLNGRSWEQVRPLAVVVLLLLPAAGLLGRGLRILALGDDAARALGLRIGLTQAGTVAVGVGLTASATAAAGPIMFLALAAPQIARRLTAADGVSIAGSALTGSALLLVSDFLAQRIIDPVQLPVGVVTGCLGGIYLAWLLGREWRKGRG